MREKKKKKLEIDKRNIFESINNNNFFVGGSKRERVEPARDIAF